MAVESGEVLQERVDRLESRWTIAGLAADYCHGLDLHDIERFMSIWTPDGFFAVGEPHGDFSGDEQLRRAAELIWETLPETHHWTTNLVITFQDPDHATGLSSVHTEAVNSEGSHLSIAATYSDGYERREDAWQISSRRCETYYFKPLALAESGQPAGGPEASTASE